MRPNRTFFQNIGRMIKFRLLVPLMRSQKPPEYKAKGVAVGLAWAMTPLVGIQMWLVFMTWVIWKKFSASLFAVPRALMTVPPRAPNSFAASITVSLNPAFTIQTISSCVYSIIVAPFLFTLISCRFSVVA